MVPDAKCVQDLWHSPNEIANNVSRDNIGAWFVNINDWFKKYLNVYASIVELSPYTRGVPVMTSQLSFTKPQTHIAQIQPSFFKSFLSSFVTVMTRVMYQTTFKHSW